MILLPCLEYYGYPAFTKSYPTFITIVDLPLPLWLPSLHQVSLSFYQ